MHILILIGLVLAVIFGPQLWAQYVLQKYSRSTDSIPGTGAELAQHLLQRFGMHEVKVERTEAGDHYDPLTKTIRLGKLSHDVRSLTAVAIAAHETGHAMQHHRNEALLGWRTRLVYFAQFAERAGAVAMMAVPFVVGISRAPSAGLVAAMIGLVALGSAVIVHLVTLPVEWDASFNKAMPVLEEGNYIAPHELNAARTVLKACALTYVAGSLASLLNLWRWLAILRPLLRR